MNMSIFTNRISIGALLVLITLSPTIMYPMLSRSIKFKSFPAKVRQRYNSSHIGIGAAIAESHVLKNMLLVKTSNPCPTIKLIHSLFYQPESAKVIPITDKSAVTCALNFDIVELVINATQHGFFKEKLSFIADKWQTEYIKIAKEQKKDNREKIEDLLNSINEAYEVDKELLKSILFGFLWKSKRMEQPKTQQTTHFQEEISKIKDPLNKLNYAKANLTLAIDAIITGKIENVLDPKILSHEYNNPASRALFYVHANPCIDRPLLKKALDNNWKSCAINPSIYYALPVNDDYQKINVISDILFFNTDKQSIDYAYALFKSLSQDSQIMLMPNILRSDSFLNTLQKDESFVYHFNNFVIHNAEQIMETMKEADGNFVDMITKFNQCMSTGELKDQFFKTYKSFLFNQNNALKMRNAKE